MIRPSGALRSSALLALLALLACGGFAGALAAGAGPPEPRPALAPRVPVVPSPLTDTFALRGIYYHASISTDGRLDSDAGVPGTPFSAEDDFGLADQVDQGRMELTFRIRGQHRVRADYLKLDRAATAVMARTIRFRNTVFNPGDLVESRLDLRAMGLAYSWMPLRRENYEFGLGAGLHLVDASSSAVVRARGIREEGSAVGILPTLSIDGTWRFARRWSVSGHLQYLSVGSSDIDGSYADHHVDVQYRWKPNVAVGLGWSLLKLDVDVQDDELPGTLVLDANGPELFFRVSF
jgi:hypothetical protein